MLSWVAHLAGSQGESRASHAASLPHAHQAADPALMSPRRTCPPPTICLQLDRATGGPETVSPSTSWECGGIRWWVGSTPRSCCLGSGQFWGSVWGSGVTEEEVQPCPQLLRQSGPCLLRWAHRPPRRALPPGATAFPWQLLPTPRRGLEPCREASPSGPFLAVCPANAKPP